MAKSSLPSAFWSIWAGQLVSNFATQVCLYSLGLHFLQQNGRLSSLASIAITIQLAKVLTLPLLGRYLEALTPKMVMMIANIVRSMAMLGILILMSNKVVTFVQLMPLVVLAAAAEVTLVITFTALLDQLVPSESLPKAVGIAISSDGLATQSAPFLGAITISIAGLLGIGVINAISFVLAFALLALTAFPVTVQSLAHAGQAGQRGARKSLRLIWEVGGTRVLLLHSMATAALLASIEILFPAWVLAHMGFVRLNFALIMVLLGYVIGLYLWSALNLSRRPLFVLGAECAQSVVLIGAGLQVFQDLYFVWLAGVLGYSIAIPIVCSAQQFQWQLNLPQQSRAKYLAALNSVVWISRIAAFVLVGFVVDRLLIHASVWLSSPGWLQVAIGADPGRPIAMALCGLGLLQAVEIVLMGRRLSVDS